MPQGISPLHSHYSAADLDVKMETLAPKIERLKVYNIYYERMVHATRQSTVCSRQQQCLMVWGLLMNISSPPQPLHSVSTLAWPLNVFFSVLVLTELAINTATMWRQRKHYYTQNVEIEVE